MSAGTPFTGKDITFKNGSPAAAQVSVAGWLINIESKSSDYATNDTSGWTKTLTGVSTWSGTLTILLHDGEAQPFYSGQEVTGCQFHINAGSYISGTIKITGVSNIGTSVDSADPVAVEYAFKGQGAPSETGGVFKLA
jgi:hypothetical protein